MPYQKTVTLIRHGQCVDHGRDDDNPALSALGVQQAEITGSALTALPVTTIYHSPLIRAAHTADLIGQHHPNALKVTLETLREGVPTIPPDFQTYFTKLVQTRQNATPEAVNAYRCTLDEAFAQIFLPGDHPNTHDLVVCHGNVIKYLVCRALGVDGHTWVRLMVHHCGITQIVVAPETMQRLSDSDAVQSVLLTFNETRHLPETLRTM